MQLLSAEEVKTKEKVNLAEKMELTRKINEEETAASKKLNETKAHVEAETKRLTDELTEHEKRTAERKKELTQEVQSLETRRKDALKPIDESIRQSEKLLATIEEKNLDLENREAEIGSAKEVLSERLEAILDRETDAMEKDKVLDVRQKNVEYAEEKNKESTASLSEKWIEYHRAVTEKNREFEKREIEVQAGKKANEAQRVEWERRKKDQDQLDIQLKDRSATLERSAAEIHNKIKNHN